MAVRGIFAVVALAFTLAVSACSRKSTPEVGGEPASGEKTPDESTTTLLVAYGSEKKNWLDEAVRQFNDSSPKASSGKRLRVEATAMGSGEAVQAILSGTQKPHVFSPASGAYISLLNRRWLTVAGHTKPISPAGEPIVLSPVVIATWKPMAEALGWPGKPLGWKDLLAVNANPAGWGAFGHPEWGTFKLGHTHPEYSNSGLLAVLAEAYAGAKKQRGLELADLEAKETAKFVHDVEASIVHYGKSTGFFFDKMIERGPAYLSAAVLYENLVVESYSKAGNASFPMVALYPSEGTFWSDHPYAVLDADWVTPDTRDAAAQLLAFLKAKPRQERALALGFRPADPSIAIAAPIDAAHGADPKQPSTLLDVPDAETLDKLIELFKREKKHANVVLVFDKSGSMEGKPLAEAKAGAEAFLRTLDDRDSVTLLFFDDKVYPPVGPHELTTHRDALALRIRQAIASGGTALYDATLRARELLGSVSVDPNRITAVVVMTDGKDENSKKGIGDVERAVRVEGTQAPVRVFTIAYGNQAEASQLGRIAEAGHGSAAKGDVSSIVEIYKDMASFF